jgi:hypothetical protein
MDFVFSAELNINKLEQLAYCATSPTVPPAPLKTFVIFALDSMCLRMEAACLKFVELAINPPMDFAPHVILAVPIVLILSVVAVLIAFTLAKTCAVLALIIVLLVPVLSAALKLIHQPASLSLKHPQELPS